MVRKTKKYRKLFGPIVPERYRLVIHPNLKTFDFRGDETIYFRITKTTKQIVLHALDLEIEKAIFIRSGAALEPRMITTDRKNESICIKFPKILPKGAGDLTLSFRGKIAEGLRGLYRSQYEVNGEKRYLAMTQLESTDARRVFPCIDEPEAKAVFDVTVMAKKEHVVIGNTMPIDVTEHAGDIRAVRFAPTPKMSTYLLAFLVGEFEFMERRTKHGVLIRVFTTPKKRHQAEFALSVAAQALEFYTEYFNIPYPLPVLDLIAVPDFEAAAMENWGAITYRESALLIDADNSSVENRQWVAIVVVHELAHQWFGNLVTMKWWTHLWLNEGFARFMEYMVLDNLFPEWNMWAQYSNDVQGIALRLDSLRATHPVEADVNYPKEIGEIFDQISYAKGASVIRMLWAYLGEKVFRDGLRAYLKTHAYGNTETEDLWRAFEKISGRPVRKIMQAWTRNPGYPVVEIKKSGSGLVMKQRRFIAAGPKTLLPGKEESWQLPISLKKGGSPSQQHELLNKKSIRVKCGPDEWLKANYGETSFCRVIYDKDMFLKLGEAAARMEFPERDRLGIVRDVFASAEAGLTGADLALRVSEYYKNETDYAVWLEITENLDRLDSVLYGTPVAGSFKNWVKNILSPAAKKSGYEPVPNESHTDKLKRGLLLSEAGGYGDPEIKQWAIGMFWGNAAPLADLRSSIYGIAAKCGGEKEQKELIRRYRSADLQEEKDRLGLALASVSKKNLLPAVWKFVLSGEVREQDAVHIIRALLRNPAAQEFAWRKIRKDWRKISEKYSAGGLSLPRLVQELGNLSRKSAIREIREFFRKNPIGAARSVEQAMEKIKINANFRRLASIKIRDYLKSNKVV